MSRMRTFCNNFNRFVKAGRVNLDTGVARNREKSSRLGSIEVDTKVLEKVLKIR